MNLKDYHTKFQDKTDEVIFHRYSQNIATYKVMNRRTRKIEETFSWTFDDYFVKRVKNVFFAETNIFKLSREF